MEPWQKQNFHFSMNYQKDELEQTTRIYDFFFQQNMIMSKTFGNQDFSKLMKIFGTILDMKACSFL